MAEEQQADQRFRFGVFELDGATGDLRRDGKACPRLQGQPLALLLALLNRPARPVSREELRQLMWPADTFVDYDHSLNAAVNKLREALGDSADSPRFIQTIPRLGYRFIAPVERTGAAGEPDPRGALPAGVDAHSLPSAAAQFDNPALIGTAHPSRTGGNRSTVLSDSHELPAISRRQARFLFSLIQLLYFGFYVAALADLRKTEVLALQAFPHASWVLGIMILTAAAGIPIRLYLLAAAAFGYAGLTTSFKKIFPVLLPLDEMWALAPFLIADWIGIGLALAATAAFLFLPFSQRSLLLMGEQSLDHA